MTAGNHDSPARMEVPAPFLAMLDAHAVGHTGRAGDGVDLAKLVIPLKDATGAIQAWCIAMPFLRPSDLPRIEAEDPYLAGIADLYAQAYAWADAQRSPGQAIIALGHCHITGGQVSSESERRLVIGGSESLHVSIFNPDIAYVALGHLHLAQKVGGDPTRRYCGSPLPLSFSEIDYPHQVLVVALASGTVSEVRELRIPRSVALLRIPRQPGPLAEVLQALQTMDVGQLVGRPDLKDCPQDQWPYLQVRVQLDQPEPALRASVEAALENKPVRLVRIETRAAQASGPNDGTTLPPELGIDALRKLDPATYFGRLYQHRYGEAPPDAIAAAFKELLNASTDAGARA